MTDYTGSEDSKSIVDDTLIEFVIFLLFISFFYVASIQGDQGGTGEGDTGRREEYPDSIRIPVDSLAGLIDIRDSLKLYQGRDDPPCLTKSESLKPREQFVITAEDSKFKVEFSESAPDSVRSISPLSRLSNSNFVSESRFEKWGNQVLAYTEKRSTFDRRCRCYAEIRLRSSSGPAAAADALTITRYVYPGNPYRGRIEEIEESTES